ncbi:AraC family transcriptional regulator [Eisenbergiella sp.]
MNIKRILHQNVDKRTKEQSHLINNRNHGETLEKTYHIRLSGSRPLYDLFTLTGWYTNTQGIRGFLYATITDPKCYAWNLSFKPGTLCEIHEHSHIELIYVIEGTLKILIGSEEFTFDQREFVLINSGVLHGEYLNNEECTLLCLGIDDSFFDKSAEPQQKLDYMHNLKKLINEKRREYCYIRFSPTNDSPQTISALTIILNEMCDSLPGKKRIVLGYVERIVDLLTKEFQFQVARQDTGHLHEALLRDIKNYIRCNYSRVTVGQISAVFHYSADYLNRIFRRQTGMTLSAYIQDIRLSEAMWLLGTTKDSIESIALQVGYHNQGFFYCKFKEKYQALPGDVRKEKFGFF